MATKKTGVETLPKPIEERSFKLKENQILCIGSIRISSNEELENFKKTNPKIVIFWADKKLIQEV